jgi:membrane fusion protein (multidrug efflux system)
MYGSVKLAIEKRDDALTVPANALINESGRSYVYAVIDGKAKRIEVRTGLDDGIRVECTEGLTGNEQIIVSGTSGIKDGLPVKVVASS